MAANVISEYTRRDLFDRLTLEAVDWPGRISESSFLERIFKISELPSRDHRVSSMLGDVALHRENFYDWGGPEWVWDDDRIDLMGCSDEKLLEFLAFMVHPRVRPEQTEVDRIIDIVNPFIAKDGYQLGVLEEISGKRIFAGMPTVAQHGVTIDDAARVADEMASMHVARQVARMKASIVNDPSLAIGSAKEFLESIAKGILRAHSVTLTGGEAMPLLVKMARDRLELSVTRETEEVLKRTLAGLSNVTQGVAELRGRLGTGHGAGPETEHPSVEVARLVVGMATTLGVYLYETHAKHRVSPPSPPKPAWALIGAKRPWNSRDGSIPSV
jgi:hypothetical protein